MRYLQAALASEDESDDKVLGTLLFRALQDMCGTCFDEDVEVAPVHAVAAEIGR